MKKIFPMLVLVLIVSILIIWAYMSRKTTVTEITQPIPEVESIDVKNITYTIDGESFTLVHGVAQKDIAPNSATKNTLAFFGEPVYGDVNNDGIDDAAILLVNNPGGSGTFYYAVLAIAIGNTYVATNAINLGDRIAPQTVEIHDGQVIYNYAERKAGESMTTQPSIGKSFYVSYNKSTHVISELQKKSPSVIVTNQPKYSLTAKKWEWVKTQMNDGKVYAPKKAGVFGITFTNDGKVSLTTDCNSMGGSYTLDGNKIFFTRMMSTMMYCDGSQEGEFSQSIYEVGSYTFSSTGELILEIKMDSGVIIFK